MINTWYMQIYISAQKTQSYYTVLIFVHQFSIHLFKLTQRQSQSKHYVWNP